MPSPHQRALKTGNAHLALAAAAELRHVDLAVRWLSRYTAEERQLRLGEARELVDMLAADRRVW